MLRYSLPSELVEEFSVIRRVLATPLLSLDIGPVANRAHFDTFSTIKALAKIKHHLTSSGTCQTRQFRRSWQTGSQFYLGLAMPMDEMDVKRVKPYLETQLDLCNTC